MRRVLIPGGRVLLSVWRIMGPYNVAVVDALSMHVGADAAATFSASRTVPDADELHHLVVGAGFREVTIQPSAMNIRLPAVEKFVLSHLAATPVASAVAAIGSDVRAALVHQIGLALRAYVDGDGVMVPDETNLVKAIA